jgi:Fur family ferric uptake transcriptional regulator
MIEEVFKNNAIKNTKQRHLVYNVVLESNEDATIRYIYDKVGSEVDMTTIYRIIELFVNKSLFNKCLDYKGDIYYTVNSFNHRHFINCIRCHKKQEINFCPIKNIGQNIEDYEIVNHNLEINGICKKCNKRNS